MSANELSAAWDRLRRRVQAGVPRPDLEKPAVRRCTAAGITLDYSRALVDDEVLGELDGLARAACIGEKLAGMLSGAKLNFTERRAAWHCELRNPAAGEQVHNELRRASAFAEQVRAQGMPGENGRPCRHVLHIGIGGSYLGPKLLAEALGGDGPEVRFVANVDPAALADSCRGLDPATTLVVTVSKSGGTAETGDNTSAAMAWLAASLGGKRAAKRLVVVSANPRAAEIYGSAAEQTFAIWDWVGGRYSLWSAVSVSAMISCGAQPFALFLAGARTMDEHAARSSGTASMPTLLALLRAWHSLATGAQTHCVIAYSHRLRSLAPYLQQLVMESNGKSVARSGGQPHADTAEIWWGGEGTNDQHSYLQLLLQGTRACPADFVAFLEPRGDEDAARHRRLLAHCFGISSALMCGISASDIRPRLEKQGVDNAGTLSRHMEVRGGQPTNLLISKQLTPEALGALLALYEHQTAAAGWLCDINSFDQYGVELGKSNYHSVLAALESGSTKGLDEPTASLVRLARQI